MLQHKRIAIVACVLMLVLSPLAISSVKTEESQRASDEPTERWEYLVVTNASRTNFHPTGNPRMRKAEMGGFGIEAFVLEQHLDDLGAKGWELVDVAGNPMDPIFYFKRPKQQRD